MLQEHYLLRDDPIYSKCLILNEMRSWGTASKRRQDNYLDAIPKLRRNILIITIRNFEIQNKAHSFPITITKEHCCWVSRHLAQNDKYNK